jgi:predicted permease
MIRPGIRRLFRLPARGAERTEQDLEEEIQLHVELRAEQLQREGFSPEEALAEARRRFGTRDEVQGTLRRAAHRRESRVRAREWAHEIWRDLRFGSRQLARAPGFAATAILSLALGIGASTAIFSVVDGVLLKPLPFRDPERLVGVYHQDANQGPGTYFTYRDNNRVFEDIGAWETDEVSITGRGEPERVQALAVTDATLPLLGVRPALGRLFTREDDTPGSPVRVILTYGYWQRGFGGARDVIGRLLYVGGRPAEIIGVLPASFRFLRSDPTVVLPMQLDRADASSFDFQALARLKPGVTLAQANADVARMIPLLPPQYAAFRLRPMVQPLARDLTGGIDQVLWVLMGAVGVVLLIACVNVANLFLIRMEGRQQELAVRAALGASRGRMARQLLSESVLLGLAGGAVGLLLAQAGIGLLRRLAPAELPRVDEIGLDPSVLLFALLVSVLSGVLLGLIPTLRFGAPNTAALRDGGRAASDAPGRHRVRSRLVVVEVALSVMLLILSGLMVRTLLAMRQVDPGFTHPEQVQTFRLSVADGTDGDPRRAAREYEQIAQRLKQVPGVAAVGLSSSATMDGEDNTNPLFVEGVPVPDGAFPPFRRFKSLAPGYFEAMGNRIVAGRSITWADIDQARPVVVISAKLAREYWQQPSRALGKRVRNSRDGRWNEIVGVVGDERDDGLNRPATAIVYWPMLSDSYQPSTMVVAVRSSRVGTPGFLQELRQAVWSVDPDLPLASVRTLDQIRADSMTQTSFVVIMLGIAAAIALLLGIVGIYGVIAYIAAQRTREIGIRMALGAQAGDVRRLFLRHGLGLTLTGIALGIGASIPLTRVVSAFLFGVGPMDPVTYLAVAVGLTAIALLATYLPARHASRVDPIVAMRSGG